MRRHLVLSSATIGLMLTSGWAYAQTSGERNDEPKRTEQPAKGAGQHGQGSGQERAHGGPERLQDERAQGAARNEKGGAGQATEKTHPAAAAEHNQPKANEQAQKSRESAREGNREAEGTNHYRESGKNSPETRESKSNAETRQESSGTQKSIADSEKSKNGRAGQRNEHSGTAANQNEGNENKPSRNTAEKQPTDQQSTRPAAANDTNPTRSTGNAQNAPSATGAQTHQADRTNDRQVDQQSRVTYEKQVRMSETFSREKLAAPERDQNISIRVGEAVPPRVHLHRIPPEIVSIEPEYRDYEYFATDEDIVIVEPSTHRIVSEVPRDPSRARSHLSSGSVAAGGGSMAAAGKGNVNCKILRRDASGNVAEVEPSTVGSNAGTDSLSVTVQLPGGGSSAPIALGASAGDIVVATEGQEDCTVTLEPQTR